MTSEVLIMNEMGVTLAADSAATVGGKVFTANKLHRLSDTQPVAVMVYGVSSVDGVPIELLIGEHRRRLGSQTFDTVKEYAEDFINFLSMEGKMGCGSTITEGYRKDFLLDALVVLVRALTRHMHSNSNDSDGCMDVGDDSDEFVSSFLDSRLECLETDLDQNAMVELTDIVEQAIADDVSRLSAINQNPMWRLNECRKKVVEILVRKVMSRDSLGMDTGLVFAGFGSTEYFPSFVEYSIHGLFGSILSHSILSEGSVDNTSKSMVLTFAQDDMMRAFLNGASPDVVKAIRHQMMVLIDGITEELLDRSYSDDVRVRIHKAVEKTIDILFDELNGSIVSSYRYPVERTLSFLSKGEMATLAESLVYITSVRRRVASEVESVRGPIDVAFLSKHGGMEWIRKKDDRCRLNTIHFMEE